MTIEGFKRARELDSLINKAKEDKYCLENLATRLEEIKTTQQFKGVAIKINEAWCYTPEGSVDIFDFADFLRKETEQLDNLIAVYKKEFAEL